MEITVVRAYVRQRLDKAGQPWVGTVEYTTSAEPGKRKSCSRTFDPSKVKKKEQAERKLKKFRDELFAELAKKPEPKPQQPDAEMPVSEYVDRITKQRIAAEKLEDSTAYGYRFSMQHIRDGFSAVKLRDLKPSHVIAWIADMNRAGLSPATVSKAFRLLKQALDQAVEDDVIGSNPCAKRSVKLPRIRKPEHNVLDSKRRAELVAALGRMSRTSTIIAAYLAMLTGARRGELCGLRWGDVDIDNATISIRRSIGIREGGCFIKAPKSENGTRVIPISSALMPIIAAHRDSMRADWMALMDRADLPHDDAAFNSLYVLGTLDGRFPNPTKMGKKWQALAESLNLVGTQGRLITLHDLRHDVATIASNGVMANPVAVANNMGHHSVEFTLENYAGPDLEAKRRVAEQVGDAYFKQADRG